MTSQPHAKLLQVTHRNGGIVARLAADALDEGNVQAAGEALYAVAGRLAGPRLWLDLTEVKFLTSTGLGKLCSLHRRLREAGGHLTLLNVQDPVYELFEVTRLTRVLDVRRPAASPRLAS